MKNETIGSSDRLSDRLDNLHASIISERLDAQKRVEALPGYRAPRRRRAKPLTARERKESARIREKITNDQRSAILGTSLDSHSEIAALSLLDKETRQVLIDRAADGEATSAMHALAKRKAAWSEKKTVQSILSETLRNADPDMLNVAYRDATKHHEEVRQVETATLALTPDAVTSCERRLMEAHLAERQAVNDLRTARKEKVAAFLVLESFEPTDFNHSRKPSDAIYEFAHESPDSIEATEWLLEHGYNAAGRPLPFAKQPANAWDDALHYRKSADGKNRSGEQVKVRTSETLVPPISENKSGLMSLGTDADHLYRCNNTKRCIAQKKDA